MGNAGLRDVFFKASIVNYTNEDLSVTAPNYPLIIVKPNQKIEGISSSSRVTIGNRSINIWDVVCPKDEQVFSLGDYCLFYNHKDGTHEYRMIQMSVPVDWEEEGECLSDFGIELPTFPKHYQRIINKSYTDVVIQCERYLEGTWFVLRAGHQTYHKGKYLDDYKSTRSDNKEIFSILKRMI